LSLEINCECCGIAFCAHTPNRKGGRTSKFCSVQCNARQWARKKLGWVAAEPRECLFCKTEFTPDAFHPKALFCSPTCNRSFYYIENKAKKIAYNMEWIKNNPDKRRAYHRVNYNRNIIAKRIQKKVRVVASVSKKYFLEMCKAQGYLCNLCFNLFPPSRLSIDHIHPVARGGTNNPNNLHILCLRCNQSKGARIMSGLKATIPS
jgi:5-methylcytosine-specific restriction endonuclease McrA